MISPSLLNQMIEHFDMQARNAPTRHLGDLYDAFRTALRAEVLGQGATKIEGLDAYAHAARAALDEVKRARELFGPMYSMHEGFAIIQEESDEVWDIVKMKQKLRNLPDARKEAIQCAAMWVAFAVEVCNEERGRR